MIKGLIKLIVMAFCALYLLNPGFGVFEFIPDFMPGIGNLDEGAMGALLLLLLQSFGKRTPPPQTPPR